MLTTISKLVTDHSAHALKIVIAAVVIWILAAMVTCSCCKYTVGDMFRLATHFAYNVISGSDEVTIEIADIRKKTCECKSPWYSPCVIWGSKNAKDGGCTKDCHKEKKAVEDGVDESLTKTKGGASKEAFGCGCGKTGTDIGDGVTGAFANDPFILQNRGGNRR